MLKSIMPSIIALDDLLHNNKYSPLLSANIAASHSCLQAEGVNQCVRYECLITEGLPKLCKTMQLKKCNHN